MKRFTDDKGQISIEYILIISFILVTAIVTGSTIGPEIEKNKIAGIARTTTASYIGQTNSESALTTPRKVTSVNITDSQLTITIKPSFETSTEMNQVRTAIIGNLTVEGYSSAGNTIIGNHHNYLITIN